MTECGKIPKWGGNTPSCLGKSQSTMSHWGQVLKYIGWADISVGKSTWWTTGRIWVWTSRTHIKSGTATYSYNSNPWWGRGKMETGGATEWAATLVYITKTKTTQQQQQQQTRQKVRTDTQCYSMVSKFQLWQRNTYIYKWTHTHTHSRACTQTNTRSGDRSLLEKHSCLYY